MATTTMTASALQKYIADKIAESNQVLAERFEESLRKAQERTNGAVGNFAATQDTPVHARDAWDATWSHRPSVRGYEDPQMISAGVLRTCVAARKYRQNPMDIATRQYGKDHPVTKALAASDFDSGGAFVPGVFSSDLIELLRATAVVEKAGPSRVPLDRGTLTIPKITAGTAAAWLGENSNITNTEIETGVVNLVAKKLAGQVVISNDLLKFASIDADRTVRDDLVRGMVLKLDLAYLMGDGLEGEPLGFAYMNGTNTQAANTTVSAATVADELGEAIQLAEEDNVPLTRPYWFFAPRTKKYLATAMDSNSNYIWRDEINGGRLLGIPFLVSNQIPTNLATTSTAESLVFLVDMPDIVVGQGSTIEVDASGEAAYYDGSAVQAAFSRDQTVVRAITHVDIVARHAESIVKTTTVKWGV